MLGKIFGCLSSVSIICAVMTGRTLELGNAILSGASAAVELVITLMGVMCLFTGVAKVLDIAGFTALIAKVLRPIFRLIYPTAYKRNIAIDEIASDFGANLLGLGNAALPFGIRAMKALCKLGLPLDETANDDMVTFAVLNTTPIQFMPTTLIALRMAAGSASAFDIVIPVWICSVATTAFAVLLCKLLSRICR